MATTSFARDIKPLMTETDRQHMLMMFDLWSYDDVKQNAADIYDAVSNKRMPPPPPQGDGPWPADRVALFKRWIDDGYPQ
jgi:hypothetical protein